MAQLFTGNNILMNVVCCTDHRFIMPTGVMLKSLSFNNPNHKITVFVIVDNSVTERDKVSLEHVFNNPNHVVHFCDVPDNLMGNFPMIGVTHKHVTQATYYRLFLTEMLPVQVDKVIYLDGDIIVRHDLADFWTKELPTAVGVVVDMDENLALQRVSYPRQYGYFNAGVLLINLKYWRDNHLLKTFMNFIRDDFDKIVYHDQDVLNYTLCNQKNQMPLTYNCQSGFLYKKEFLNIDYSKYEDDLNTAVGDPVILHFALTKPWFTGCNNPYREEFFKYLKMTEWKDYKIKEQNTTFKRKCANLLRRLGLLAPLYSDYDKYIDKKD